MPQKTNLNISPYYDDFDKAKNFYKVLFKPGSPVQARELTGLQSILQNQVESFGKHIFKEVRWSYQVALSMILLTFHVKSIQIILELMYQYT